MTERWQNQTLQNPQRKLELLLQYRPAARVIFYAYEPGGDLRVLLGLHRRNQRYTLPGGRLEAQDAVSGCSWADIWYYTLYRELKEELGFSSYDEYSFQYHDRVKQLGLVLWRHPQTDEVCVDLVGAVRCEVGWKPNIPQDSELQELTWVPWYADEVKEYLNVDLAVEMLHEHLIGRRPPAGEITIRYLYADFESDAHYRDVRSQIVMLLS